MRNEEILSKRPTGKQHPREVLRYGITESALDGETVLFDVLPGIGKSRSIPKVASGTCMPITILTNLSENYDQYRHWGKEDGISVDKLPVAPDLCPTLQGDYSDDADAKDAREAYNAGWPVSAIHREFDVPCSRGKDTCPYHEAVAELDPNGTDPLVGHFTQAYNPAYIEDRVIVLDEDCFSDYVHQIKNPVEKAKKFIATLDDFPFESVRRPEPGEEDKRVDALKQLEEHGLKPSKYRGSAGEFHAKSPIVTYAIYGADRMENDLYLAELPNGQTAVFDNLLGGEDDHGSIRILDPPDFSKAKAVIALDATPCVSNWRRILGEDLNHCRLFDDDKRNRYLREQGYEFIQLNGHVWPVSGADVSIAKCEAYLREIARKHGQRPDLITSMGLRERLKEEGLGDLWRDALHYGGFRGKNDIADSELLVVLGSPSRPDSDIQFQAALHGDCAEPATEDGERLSGYDLDYQSDIANDIIESIRRGGVLQAAMRAGREVDAEATVYIATGMVPHWLETKKAGRGVTNGPFDACTNLRSAGEKQVIRALRGAEEMSPSELYEQVDISKDRAKKLRQVLQERGLVEKEGERRWARYGDTGLGNINIAGSVDLSLSVCSPLKNSIRGDTPIESKPKTVVPRSDPSKLPPEERYPDWMRNTMRRTHERKFDEQMKQAWRDES